MEDFEDVDAILVTNGTNRRYLTGFTAEDHAADESSGVVLATREAQTLFTSPTNVPWARSEANEGVEVEAATRPWTSAVAAAIRARGFRRLGFEDGTTTVRDHAALQSALESSSELIPIGDRIDRRRAEKRDDELASIRSALQLTDLAFERASARIAVAMSEREVADLVREELRNVGSDGEAFPTIVASGPNAAKPHHTPGDRELAPSEPIIIDMGAKVKGYCGDLTRTIWLGQPSDQLVTMYRVLADAQRAAIAAVGAGVPTRDVDQAARDICEAAGLGQYVIHSVGHGLGLRVHEAPSVGQMSDERLRSRHVITIEPGLYVHDWGGVRIEDVVVVTDGGSRNLTSAAKLTP